MPILSVYHNFLLCGRGGCLKRGFLETGGSIAEEPGLVDEMIAVGTGVPVAGYGIKIGTDETRKNHGGLFFAPPGALSEGLGKR
jgi:hypothetical protein